MIKIENTEVYGWQAAIRGMIHSMDLWESSDSGVCMSSIACHSCMENRNNCKKNIDDGVFLLGKTDHDMMMKLVKTGSGEFMRMITVTADVTAPLYWWKEADIYKAGTVCNFWSIMPEICYKEFELEDFSHEHLCVNEDGTETYIGDTKYQSLDVMEFVIDFLNHYRELYLDTKDKRFWWQIIQLLPSSYNQKSTLQLNYQVLRNMYHARKDHKLTEWHDFCDWIETLPYSELIKG